MTLPNFLIIGAMKAGTTSLHGYLQAHPQVFLPDKKEVDFFALDEMWEKGLGWYEAFFEGVTDEVAIGEASPRYAFAPRWAGAPPRIAATLDRPKLIYVLRHPIARTRSMYQHAVASGWTRDPIDKVLRSDPIYVDGSRYAMQIDEFLPHFPREDLLLILSEDLRDRREETMRRIFRFLGVDDTWLPPNLDVEMHRGDEKLAPTRAGELVRRVAGPVRRLVPDPVRRLGGKVLSRPIDPEEVALSPDLEAWLLERLLPDVRRLRDEHGRDLGDDFDGWGLL